ncbi:hypothetical protein BJ508DRAFT_379327 [Ascobolus immersus RN42]|uniref:Ubiquitin 3 binding protein But2 C-terminal domain-containing protein n=1 Tax=Ascobolus immersus RN42 TaxID=1160509 RepID=A0A3N4HSA5_ASCIM|nr:hypothetical protein BJ508DRAFT_379327 [Ascobolus immersus RN42]
MKITVASVLAIISGLAVAQSPPSIKIISATPTAECGPVTGSSISTNPSQLTSELKFSYNATARYGPTIQPSGTKNKCIVEFVLEFPGNEWDFTVIRWHRVVDGKIYLENASIKAGFSDAISFDDNRIFMWGFLYGGRGWNGPYSATHDESTQIPGQERTLTVPGYASNCVKKGELRRVRFSVENTISIGSIVQSYEGPVPQSGVPGAANGEIAPSLRILSDTKCEKPTRKFLDRLNLRIPAGLRWREGFDLDGCNVALHHHRGNQWVATLFNIMPG